MDVKFDWRKDSLGDGYFQIKGHEARRVWNKEGVVFEWSKKEVEFWNSRSGTVKDPWRSTTHVRTAPSHIKIS